MELSAIAELVNELAPSPISVNNTYSAVVSRIDNEGTIWVNLAGSDMETPTASTSSEIEPNDDVNVEWRNNKLYIVGNTSNPSAGSIRVTAVEQAATQARTAAETALQDAAIAHTAAEQAQESAQNAFEAASQAQESAQEAKESADEAEDQAISATASANAAIEQLSIVEDVVGTLEWIAQHGNYALTQDAIVVEGKYYFTRSGTGTSADPYIYTVVSTPTGNPSTEGWYELVDIDESIQNYVSSHLALNSQGLWLQTDGTATKVLLSSTDGVVLYGPDGSVIGKYGSTAQIGDSTGFHIEMDGTELGFYQADRKVAYISNNQLYITQSVVLQQMDLGIPVANGGLGQWSWKVHANGLTPNRNNLNLKWIG